MAYTPSEHDKAHMGDIFGRAFSDMTAPHHGPAPRGVQPATVRAAIDPNAHQAGTTPAVMHRPGANSLHAGI